GARPVPGVPGAADAGFVVVDPQRVFGADALPAIGASVVQASEEQKEIYTRTVGEVRAEVLKAYSNKPKAQAGIVAITALTRLRQVCISPALFGKPSQSSPKFEYLLERLVELHEQSHAALIFSQFTSALDLMQPLLEEAGLPTLRLDGSTPNARRRELVKMFQDDPDHFFFLISLKAGGVGLNLTRANYVFHLDPWWNPAVENQASDRAHRIGQTQHVFVQRLVMRHTVEENMMKLKAVKRARFEALLETNALTSSGPIRLERDDFLDLLEEAGAAATPVERLHTGHS
ncbi:MAG: C-terminal helicase domain-containing protein, partial [Verrucomicrobiia bacterium]